MATPNTAPNVMRSAAWTELAAPEMWKKGCIAIELKLAPTKPSIAMEKLRIGTNSHTVCCPLLADHS